MADLGQAETVDSRTKQAIPGLSLLVAYSLCVPIALAPLPFGSTDASVIAVWVLILSAIVTVAALQPLARRDALFFAELVIIVAAWGTVVALQLGYLTISPPRPFVWDKTAALLGRDLAGNIALANHQPYLSAGSQIVCLLALTAGYLVGRDRYAAHLLTKTFAVSGLIYAVYGILAFLFWPHYWLWQEKFSYQGSLTATFINPNVAAIFFGSCTVAWMLLLTKALDVSNARHQQAQRSIFAALFDRPSRTVVICFAAAFVTLTAMFATGSRAGSVFSLIAIAGAVTTFYRRSLKVRRLTFGYWIALIALIFLALQVLGPRVSQRFDLSGLSDSGRWTAYQSTLQIVAEYPWLGTGLGTFRWAFPKYRSPETSIVGIWDRAHSTPLEIASEMGIPFASLIIIAWILVFFALVHGIRVRRRDRIFPILAFWVGVLAVTHSLIDFSMQIPGLSIVVCTLVGIGLAQSRSANNPNINSS